MANITVFQAFAAGASPPFRSKQALSSIYGNPGGFYSSGYGQGYSGGFLGFLREPFAGAWQKNVVCESRENILAFSAVYACVALISNDVAKLRIKLMQLDPDGTWLELLSSSPFLPVILKPNRYQTRQQFIAYWIVSKLLYGNAYVLKERDGRGIVTALYVLDPRRVVPLVAEDGSVYYRLNQDHLSGLQDAPTVPASEIIHDRMTTLWHPLIGVSPIYACGAAATQGMRIQGNSNKFFENMSRPSGMLTAPAAISDETAKRLKQTFEDQFSGSNVGRLFVAGDGLDYKAMTMPAVDAQLIEQLRWTIEDVSRCFLVPGYKIESSTSGRLPAANVAALAQDYYNQCLQTHIEAIEALLDEGLSLPNNYATEVDLDGLLRMDPLSRSETFKNAIGAGYMDPNYARTKEGMRPAVGGDSPYMQQQNYSLAALAKRDALPNPFVLDKPTPTATPSAAGEAATVDPAATEAAAKFMQHLKKGFDLAEFADA